MRLSWGDLPQGEDGEMSDGYFSLLNTSPPISGLGVKRVEIRN